MTKTTLNKAIELNNKITRIEKFLVSADGIWKSCFRLNYKKKSIYFFSGYYGPFKAELELEIDEAKFIIDYLSELKNSYQNELNALE
jgi:hypothetical protein